MHTSSYLPLEHDLALYIGRHSRFIPLCPPTWRMTFVSQVLLVLVAIRFSTIDTFGPNLGYPDPDFCPHLRRIEFMELTLRHWVDPLHTYSRNQKSL